MLKQVIKGKMLLVFVSMLALVGITSCQAPVADVNGLDEKAEVAKDKGPLKTVLIDKDFNASRAAGGDQYEEDDTAYKGTVITREMSAQKHNFADDATDWFKFNAKQYQAFKIETTVYGDTDTVLYLYSSSDLNNPLAQMDDKDGGNDRGSRIDWMCEADGLYYVKCYSYGGDTGADQTYEIIMLDPTTSGDSFENDDTANLAKSISTNGVPQYHNFRDDKMDWLSFNANSNYYYIIETTVKEGGADTVITLYDSESATNAIATNDDINSGWNRGSRIVYNSTSSKKLYLKVHNYSSAGPNKDYNISVTRTKLISHDKFDGSSYNGWNKFTEHGASAYLSKDNNRLKLTVNNEGKYTRSIGVFKQGVKLEKGKTYTFLFDAQKPSGEEKDIYVGLEKSSSPWSKYCPFRYYRLNRNGLTTYRSTFTMNHNTDTNSQYMMYFGKKSGNNVTYPATYYLDNMMIFENR